MPITFTQMKYFYEVCKWKSITKAAANLHVSQPTVSISMCDLEKESGLNLFRREGKKLTLTEDGTLLLSKITPLLLNLKQLDRDIKDMSQNKNLIRLAVPLQIGVQLLPKIFCDFKKLYPKIELEIVEAGGIDSLRMLETEELDLAITNYDDSFSPNLRYHKLFKSEACFCTYPQHPLAKKHSVDTTDIADEPLVLLNGGFFVNRLIQQNFQQALITPKVILHSAQLHTVKNLIANKVASSFLMRQAITANDNIVPIPLKNPLFINSGIVTKRGRQIYGDEKKLIEFICTSKLIE